MFVRVDATGLQPNTTYVVDCHWSGDPGGFSPTNKTSDGAGNLVDPNACYYGQAGRVLDDGRVRTSRTT